jgi:hypothetical protein
MRKKMSQVKKQAITGFKIMKYDSRKARDTEKFRIILEAEVDSIGTGNFSIGDILGALQHHQTGETDVGLTVFVTTNNEELEDSEE